MRRNLRTRTRQCRGKQWLHMGHGVTRAHLQQVEFDRENHLLHTPECECRGMRCCQPSAAVHYRRCDTRRGAAAANPGLLSSSAWQRNNEAGAASSRGDRMAAESVAQRALARSSHVLLPPAPRVTEAPPTPPITRGGHLHASSLRRTSSASDGPVTPTKRTTRSTFQFAVRCRPGQQRFARVRTGPQ